MPMYLIHANSTSGTGKVDAEGRLKFGGLTVEYLPAKNRFLLSDPHRRESGVFIFEADIPQFLAYFMEHFEPFDDSISKARNWNGQTKSMLKALCVVNRVLAEVSGWTSKYCTDCLAQRDRSLKTREILDLLLGGDIEHLMILQDPRIYRDGVALADAIQDYVCEKKAKRGIIAT